MRRRVVQGLLLVVALGFAAGAYFRLFSGDPMPYLGGGWLRGDVVTQPVSDWSFIPKQQHNLDVESRAGDRSAEQSDVGHILSVGPFAARLPGNPIPGLDKRKPRV